MVLLFAPLPWFPNSLTEVTAALIFTKRGSVKTPSGFYVPEGAAVYAPAYAILHYLVKYIKTQPFKPFQFAEKRADIECKDRSRYASGKDGGGEEKGLPSSCVWRAQQAFITTSLERTADNAQINLTLLPPHTWAPAPPGYDYIACPGHLFAAIVRDRSVVAASVTV
ncbi:hypothetical protein F5Y04DRAFT_280482 [Hypomontagnella monticulosa]|nr:hypothetical protein F5Y04DRAFT_280482 [Hypomontagnella monticulosa]